MAPNKKYLSLEEAAAQLGVKPDELIRLREKGDVRGFADRGTWKFKADDVEECRRRREPDSDPDMQILDDISDDDLGSRATIIRKSGATDSDSDVRMIGDDRKKSSLSGSSDELSIPGDMDSDSDVRLVEPKKTSGNLSSSDVTVIIPNAPRKSDSDSDVRLIDKPSDSDSDVKIVAPSRSLADSDSDIRLAPFSDSDSDVKLIGPKSSIKKSDSDVTLISKNKKSSTNQQDSGSGIDLDSDNTDSQGTSLLGHDDSNLPLGGDSGIRLSADSGIRLSADSGIRLSGDSGIRLADDSGVQLKQPADSGISLEGKDSGIRLADSGIVLNDSGLDLEGSGKTFDLLAESSVSKRKGGSSKKLSKSAPQTEPELASTDAMDFDDDFGATAPMLHVPDDDDASASDLESFDAGATSELDSFDDSGQNVVMFDDEDEEEAAPVSKKRSPKTVEESIFEIDEVADEPGEEFEVSDDDLSGETDLDDLAYDDAEEDSDDFSAGTSKLGFGASKKVAVAREVEWSAGFCSLLLASLCMLIAGTWVSADLLRTVWAGGEDASAVYPGIAGLLAAFWK